MKYTGICSAYMQLSIRRGQVVEGERLCEANFLQNLHNKLPPKWLDDERKVEVILCRV